MKRDKDQSIGPGTLVQNTEQGQSSLISEVICSQGWAFENQAITQPEDAFIPLLKDRHGSILEGEK